MCKGVGRQAAYHTLKKEKCAKVLNRAEVGNNGGGGKKLLFRCKRSTPKIARDGCDWTDRETMSGWEQWEVGKDY